jgi:putative CocE/NonD family hydrolase
MRIVHQLGSVRVLALALTLLVATMSPVAHTRAQVAAGRKPSPAPSAVLFPDPGVALLANQRIAMRDGIELSTDIYLPAKNGQVLPGPFPVILKRTPYDKSQDRDVGIFYARRGYAVVQQDTRGRYASEGIWRMLADDGRDGQDTCNWVGRQPWSNGRIGMFGGSYDGGVQHALALEGCPYLKTVIPLDAISNPAYSGVRHYGAFELRMFSWIFVLGAPEGSRAARSKTARRQLERMRDERIAYLARLPIQPGTTPLRLAPEYETWLVSAMSHGGRDAFWNWANVVEGVSRYQDMPVYLVGGWYDSWAGGTAANYTALAAAKRGPIYLIMGPWVHGEQSSSSHGQVEFGAAAAVPGIGTWLGTWFDHWLKGTDNDVGRRGWFSAPVRIFVMGAGDGHKDAQGRLFHGGFWRDEHEWPLARTVYTTFFLHHDRSLSQRPPTAGVEESKISYTFDPRHPVPTIGGNTSSAPGMLQNGGWDQRGNPRIWNWQKPIPLAKRGDVVVFETAPLESDVEVTGPISVTLYVSSTARDTDFTAKLIDEYPASTDWPNSFALNLEDGIVRARFRGAFPRPFDRGSARERLMIPGRPYKLTIRLYPTSNIFKKGHRIRLDISSSNFPRFDVNPNTGGRLGAPARPRSAVNTLLLDSLHPGSLILPIIPMPKPSVAPAG